MSEINKVSDEFSAGGQPTPETLKQLADQGYKSVVNLRALDETGVLEDEEQQAQAVGLEYVNIPLKSNSADDNLTAKVLTEVEQLPTPIYFHCGAGGRASALALITFATQQQLNREQVLAKAQELGINPEQPHIKQFLDSLG
ncbi:phosphatase [Tolypothrix sp. FACHB-123]|uniref:fused DSP-PTPase phosphatase/NAD kinase-like protein n=1 Tax=Tolypothrix sp. FACHB-123 TaxID=2692868 RepID=UPI001688C49B|nr:sulfur transferase domain-containing protein [Tolypothrix sp. FACHB-123]MBD2353125.1 phosphatase [Tolypothrix sp. FACHB-123]